MRNRPSSLTWKKTAITSSLLLAGAAVVASGGGVAAFASSGHTAPSHHSPAPKLAWANTWMAAVTHGDLSGSTNVGLNDQSVR